MGTQSLDRHINLNIFSVSNVDTYNVATQPLTYETTYHLFLYVLAEETINNDLGSRTTIPQSKISGKSELSSFSNIHTTSHIYKTQKKDYIIVEYYLPTARKVQNLPNGYNMDVISLSYGSTI